VATLKLKLLVPKELEVDGFSTMFAESGIVSWSEAEETSIEIFASSAQEEAQPKRARTPQRSKPLFRILLL
jgi:hypothetical protein